MDAETFVPLMKKSLGFEGLKKFVIDQELCAGCGVCAAFCSEIEVDEDGAKLVKDCTLTKGSIKCSDEGACYDNCPMVSFSRAQLEEEVFGGTRSDPVLGYYEKIVAVKAKDKGVAKAGQDGGAVTALLQCAVETGLVAGGAVAKRSAEWDPEPEVAGKKDDLVKASGTKYARATTPATFGVNLKNHRRLALVGTGCQIAGARKLHVNLLKDAIEKTKESESPINTLLIGLFCYENFPYSKLKEKLESEFGVKMADVVKTDITSGKIIVTKKDGKELVKPVKVFNDIVPECCKLCDDFTATFSDISVGSVGSKEGWSTVVVRSKKGLELLETAQKKGYIQVSEDVDPEGIKKTGSSKDKKRDSTRQAREEKGSYVPEYT
ncbi:MAG: Coenzyme F420 hydrogenase/dehydrogenase, beta subunit C-terminal domain [Candidatus Hydrothermarchaeales archaeon]